jgi:hypothetical protein
MLQTVEKYLTKQVGEGFITSKQIGTIIVFDPAVISKIALEFSAEIAVDHRTMSFFAWSLLKFSL